MSWTTAAVCLTYLNESDDIMFFYCEAIVKSRTPSG